MEESETTPSWQSLRIMELPYETLVRAAGILDVNPALHNWRDVLALMPEYRSVGIAPTRNDDVTI